MWIYFCVHNNAAKETSALSSIVSSIDYLIFRDNNFLKGLFKGFLSLNF